MFERLSFFENIDIRKTLKELCFRVFSAFGLYTDVLRVSMRFNVILCIYDHILKHAWIVSSKCKTYCLGGGQIFRTQNTILEITR